MSTISTSVAAGVAQSAHNAQQVSRQRDKARNDRAADQAEFSKLMTERLHAPEDAEDPDAELPDRQAPGYEQLYDLPHDLPPGAVPPNGPDAVDSADATPPTPVADFHHIDVQA